MTTPWWEAGPKDTWTVYEDFKVFLALTWRHLGLPEPTPVQLDMADYLQHGPDRCIVEAFRGVGKSWITSTYVCWLLLRDPQLNILVVSASKDRSDNFTTFTLRLITEMPILQHLTPGPDQRMSKVAFDVAPALADHAPSVKSVGVMGQMAGSRADVIVPDDVEVPNNSETQMMRDKLAERVKEFDAILKPGGSIKYLGTPQTEESLYNKLRHRGYEMRVWPAQYPTATGLVTYGDRLAPFLVDQLAKHPELGLPMFNGHGAPTDPRRFDESDLTKREGSYGRSGYALQFMLDVRLADADRYPLRLDDLMVFPLDFAGAPEKPLYAKERDLVLDDLPTIGFDGDRYYKPMDYARDAGGHVLFHDYTTSILVVDPSGRGKDETSVLCLKLLNSYIYLTAMWATRKGYEPETLQKIADMARQQKVNSIIIEANFGDGMFEALLQPYVTATYPCGLEEVKHHTMKEARIIDTLEPVMNQHRLVIDPKVIQWDYESTQHMGDEEQLQYRLFHQMTRLTKDRGALKHDDRLDGLAIGVNYFVELMRLDADEEVKGHREARDDEELERFLDTSKKGHAMTRFGSTPALGGTDFTMRRGEADGDKWF